MARILRFTILLLGLSILASASAWAGTQGNVRIALHLEPYSKGDTCSLAPTALGCDSYGNVDPVSNLFVSGEIETSYLMYLVIMDINTASGLGGLSCGLTYQSGGLGQGGLALFGSMVCADQAFSSIAPNPEWPDHGSGSVFTWDTINNCQNTVDPTDPQGEALAVAAGFYVYAYAEDWVRVGTRGYLAEPDFKVSDCSAVETDIAGSIFYGWAQADYGRTGFGTSGFDPCFDSIVPVQETTWGRLKNQFNGAGY